MSTGTILSRKELLELYDDVGESSEGFTVVRKDRREFHVYPDGTPAYDERFDSVCAFHGGVALVTKNGQSFYIYPNGSDAGPGGPTAA